MPGQKYDGQTLKQAMKSAEKSLERRIDELNSLNVFPVPDGDTGINMYLTIQSANEAVENCSTKSAAEISSKIARGALIGARGNSGVILSQILRGIAMSMEMKEWFTTSDFAQGICHASEMAYRAVKQPVEGTILTVIREASEAAMQQVKRGANLRHTMSAIVTQSRNTVKKTPELLPKLRESGVVDAGAKGLMYVFQGMKSVTSREIVHQEVATKVSRKAQLSAIQDSYGFDLQFLVEGDNLPLDEMREKVGSMGESVLVVGDEHLIRVHAHTQEPRAILDYCSTKGNLKDVNIENMDKQVKMSKALNRARPREPQRP